MFIGISFRHSFAGLCLIRFNHVGCSGRPIQTRKLGSMLVARFLERLTAVFVQSLALDDAVIMAFASVTPHMTDQIAVAEPHIDSHYLSPVIQAVRHSWQLCVSLSLPVITLLALSILNRPHNDFNVAFLK